MKRTTILLIALALLAAFKAGMAFDRYLHRPIVIEFPRAPAGGGHNFHNRGVLT